MCTSSSTSSTSTSTLASGGGDRSSSFGGSGSTAVYCKEWAMSLGVKSPAVELSFDVRVPVVLYLIICSSR
ncbi:hypothetical protein TIFTF001_001508 [Ficus carica]|uniref:Uncharacterized protein n=1 Tax=Ficus carica TaxID=3494 RepID=A0AA88CRC7_FICCA|nr:hypothetical protein TIFTF001_001508 [Ficus carica]